MWLNFLILAIAGISSSYGANVNCSFGPETPPTCSSFTISPVTKKNEDIVIIGQPSDYVDVLQSSLNFDQSSTLNFIPTKLFNYFPNVQTFMAKNVSLTTLTEDAFDNCLNLNNINIMYNTISNVPARFARNCPFVQYLQLSQNKIQTVDENAFEGLESLSYLQMGMNEISCLPPLLLQHTLGLTYLTLDYNKINAVHPKFFNGLTQLCQIQLGYNQIGYIPDFELYHTCTIGMNMIWLNFNENPIMAVNPQFETNFFYSRSLIQGFSLNFNTYNENITTCIDPKAHPNNQMLYNFGTYNWVQHNSSMAHRTNCYSNWNEEMASNSMVTCGTIIEPTTTASPVTSTTSSSGSPTNAICRFYLDWKNRYSCVISGVELKVTSISGTHIDGYENVHVTRVYFFESELSKVPGILFDTFENLDFLSITNCGLSIINDHTFNKCGKLQYLDASYNDIVHVEETSLRNCTSLKTIDLTGNPVELLDSEIYKFDPALEKVHLNRVDGLELA